MRVLLLLAIFLVPLIPVAGNPLPKAISYHGNLIAVEMEDRGLRWIDLYNENMKLLWTSSKARFIEFNWSSTGSLAVKLCEGFCYNVNWQRVQVYDPATGRNWSSSEARFAKFQWSPRGELAVVLWLSPCPDYSKHWIELYDPSTGRSEKSEMRGFIYAHWLPQEKLASIVVGKDGYHLEVLNSELKLEWRSQSASVTDFKVSKEGKIAVRLELNGTQVLILWDGKSAREVARGSDIHYDWSEDGNLAYTVGGKIGIIKFGSIASSKGYLLAISISIILLILVIGIIVRREGNHPADNPQRVA